MTRLRQTHPGAGSHPRGLPPAESATSAEVRARLAETLNLDLVGPPAGHALAEERIPGWVRPSNWYLTGFLVPADAPPEQSADADEEEELDETPASAGLAEESTADGRSARRGYFPSSIGISMLVAADVETLTVRRSTWRSWSTWRFRPRLPLAA